MSNLRLALRGLWRAPGFAAAAVLVVAIGVACTTAVFSVFRAVLLKPLSAPRSEELVRLYERPAGLDARSGYSTPDHLDVAKESGAFASVGAIRPSQQSLTGRGAPVQVAVARVTASFFSTLRVWPALGDGARWS